jgi:hypothetical protein
MRVHRANRIVRILAPNARIVIGSDVINGWPAAALAYHSFLP